ncbi:hypothetical protein PMIN01_07374 [Paraphaeosphaeria minitans]|uniref:Uncharacterized protein n=1 Tax=Paraphaeosphaeria minitans TaxID=565426 RepID=A0A9P6KQ60_9PLEO|nr:hypothetical protein PMIN01_07374 [Paraphaeosphaeria minitans]
MAANAEDGWETASDSGVELESQTELENAAGADAIVESKPQAKEIGQDVESIDEVLQSNPNLKFGFVIYRCCAYDDQEKWDRFMKKLRRRTRLNLRDENAEHLYDRIDWCVQEDVELAKCSEAKIRRRFKKWIKESGEQQYWLPTSRFLACVMVDKYDLKSVLTGPSAEEFDAEGDGSVTLISLDKNEGHMSVGMSYLVPRVYALLESCGWDNFAVGDTDVACP